MRIERWRFAYLSLFLLAIACSQTSQNEPTEMPSKVGGDSVQKVDTLEEAFMRGEYFMKEFIRLHPNQFIYVDDYCVQEVFKDSAAKAYYFSVRGLNKDNREEFYQKIIAQLPKEDIAIHELIWSLEEVQEQGAESDGGLYTLATWIAERPSKENPFYSVEIRTNYCWRFGICTVIGFVRVHAKTKQIYVTDMEFVKELTLEEWRRRRKEKRD